MHYCYYAYYFAYYIIVSTIIIRPMLAVIITVIMIAGNIFENSSLIHGHTVHVVS